MQLHSKASLPVSFMCMVTKLIPYMWSRRVTERGSANDTNNLHFTYNVYVCNDRQWLWNFKEIDFVVITNSFNGFLLLFFFFNDNKSVCCFFTCHAMNCSELSAVIGQYTNHMLKIIL